MATEALKSTSVTNLDASPVVANTSGEGATGYLTSANDTVTSTSGMLLGSTYKMVRIPVEAKIRRVLFSCAAHGGSAAFDIDVAFSDSTTDGTPAALQGTIPQISSADNKLFGAAVSAVSALNHTDETFANTFTYANKNTPLWQVLTNAGATFGGVAYTTNPGGFFDIILKSTATDTSGGMLGIEVDYVMGP